MTNIPKSIYSPDHHFHRRPLSELNVIDDFLFSMILQHPDTAVPFSKLLLEVILDQHFSDITVVPQRVFSGIDTDRRGIRLDAYIEARPDDDPQVTLYDIEPQNRYSSTDELLRRDRYYTSLIDVQQLSSGQISYDLPDIVTIMILPYDPFDRGAMFYEARTRLITHTDVNYDDGIRRLYLYTDGAPNPALGEYGIVLQNMGSIIFSM